MTKAETKQSVDEGLDLIATIPYEKGKTVKYYTDRIIFDNKEIFYEDITGYGYSLTTLTRSVNFIPTSKSKTVKLSFSLGDDAKPQILSSRAESMSLSSYDRQRYRDMDVIFTEIISITDAVLAEMILSKLHNRVSSGEPIQIGGIIIEENSVRRKGFFKDKELDRYGRSYWQNGQMVIEDGQGRRFATVPLGTINGPLLGSLLDALFKG